MILSLISTFFQDFLLVILEIVTQKRILFILLCKLESVKTC
jgi:hypothetical protein